MFCEHFHIAIDLNVTVCFYEVFDSKMGGQDCKEFGDEMWSDISEEVGSYNAQDDLVVDDTVAAPVDVTIVTGMVLVSFLYRSVRICTGRWPISCLVVHSECPLTEI